MQTKILVLCVNYNTQSDTEDFVRHCAEQTAYENCQIMIANNSARDKSDPTFEHLKNDHVQVINCPENLGYFGACQRLLTEYLKQNSEIPNYVIISNVDIQFQDNQFMSKLLLIKAQQSAGVIAPAVHSSLSGVDTNPFMLKRPSRFRMQMYKYIFSNDITCQLYQIAGLVKSKMKKLFRVSTAEASRSLAGQKIYAGHGAFLIFTKKYFQAGLDFYHGAFLYGEEITTAEKCLQKKLDIIYVPSLAVIHREHASTGLIYSKRTLGFIRESSRYLADTYFKRQKQNKEEALW